MLAQCAQCYLALHVKRALYDYKSGFQIAGAVLGVKNAILDMLFL